MVNWVVQINNPSGLHLRPAGNLCKLAIEFESSISFKYNNGDGIANVKSVLSVLGACVKCGDTVEFICEGKDEEEALSRIKELVKNGLGE